MPVFIIIISVVLSIISSLGILGFIGYSSNWDFHIAIISTTWLVMFSFASAVAFRSVYLLTSVYIIALSLFHLGLTIPVGFGIFEANSWRAGTLSVWLQQAGWYTCLALGAIGIGFGISILFTKNRKTITTSTVDNYALAKAFNDGVGLFLASLILLLLTIKTFGNLLQYSRVDFFRTSYDTRTFGVFMMALPSSMILLTIGATTRYKKIFAYSVAVLGGIVLLLSGYRSALFFPTFVGVVLWVKTGRRIPIAVTVTMVVATLVLIPVIGTLRSLGPYNKLDKQDIKASVGSASAYESFRTMGQTAGLLAHVIRLVPNNEPYRYGWTYMHELRNSMPNIMPTKQSSERMAAIKKQFRDPTSIQYTIPSDWLTFKLDRNKYLRGEGVGFTAIGEPYLNFGYIGVLFYFLILGLFLGRLDCIRLTMHPNILTFAAVMYWPLIRTVRNDFGNFTKPFIFLLIMLAMWRLACLYVPILGVKKSNFIVTQNKSIEG